MTAHLDVLARKIATAAGISLRDLSGPSRQPPLPLIRHLFAWAAVAHGVSYSAIGRYLDRDHTTVLYGVRKITGLLGRPLPDAEGELGVLMRVAIPPCAVPAEKEAEAFGQAYTILEDGLIAALAGFGYNNERIGSFLGRSRKGIEYRRRSLRVEWRRLPSRVHATEIERAWLGDTGSLREIGARLGVSRGVVAGVVKRRGLMGRKGVEHGLRDA